MIKEKICIKGMKLNNRLVFPPMATGISTFDNKVNDECVEHYDKIADGESLGLIIVEHEFISKEGMASPKQLSIASDDVIEGLKRLTSCIHNRGSKVVAQINHAGAATRISITGLNTKGVSKTNKYGKLIPDIEMTKDDIKKVVKDFALAAKRAKEAGFDGVEIHSAHAYLLNQFYSPLTNSRTDEYGGKLENRIRIHLEVIEAIRKMVGDDYPIFIRLGALDYMENGSKTEDAIKACKLFLASGVDCLDISGGLCYYTDKKITYRQGYFQDECEAIKKNVNIPVILTGGIVDIFEADKLIVNKKADLIGVGRAIFNDHDWAKKEMKRI